MSYSSRLQVLECDARIKAIDVGKAGAGGRSATVYTLFSCVRLLEHFCFLVFLAAATTQLNWFLLVALVRTFDFVFIAINLVAFVVLSFVQLGVQTSNELALLGLDVASASYLTPLRYAVHAQAFFVHAVALLFLFCFDALPEVRVCAAYVENVCLCALTRMI